VLTGLLANPNIFSLKIRLLFNKSFTFVNCLLKTLIMKVWIFVQDHWELIVLTISEILALTPTKYNGVVQSVIKWIGWFVRK